MEYPTHVTNCLYDMYRVAGYTLQKSSVFDILYMQVIQLVEEKEGDKSLQQEYRLSILEQLSTVALDMVRNLPLGS